METTKKVTASHLQRGAFLYVRQSSPRQVLENIESTERQYALQQRALALGWTKGQITVVDNDQGQSGESAADREGFQKLVMEVSMGRAGIVLGLEVSRLARNCADWHRLLEICGLTDTLILDEDGIYHPGDFNDRLLLGLKGEMSAAELHIIRGRLRGGLLNKAKRGELAMQLPLGLAYDDAGRAVLDPDKQVQQAFRLLFETFRRVGTAFGVVRVFCRQGLSFPRGGAAPGEWKWGELEHHQVIRTLRNPRYAGAYFYGRTKHRKKIAGRGTVCSRLPREQWHTLILDAHPGYISWQEYEENLRRLSENMQTRGVAHRRCPPREGPALLQGLVVCGRCGGRMTVSYHYRKDRLAPYYWCAGRKEADQVLHGECQRIGGSNIDQAIGDLLVEAVNPLALDVTLAVQGELETRWEETDRLRRTQVERARYEAELARRRFLRVDPDNRLVGASLESDWNEKLRALAEAEQHYERQRQHDDQSLDSSIEEAASMGTIPTILGDLYVDDQGKDDEPVALLWPSLFTDHSMWRYQITPLRAAGWRTLALDPPGHGRSKGLERDFTMDECAEAALQVLDAMNVHTPVVVLGTSWGGMIAPRIALRAPDRVRGMVLFNTTAESATPFDRAKNTLLTWMLAIGALDKVVDRMNVSLISHPSPGAVSRNSELSLAGTFVRGTVAES